MRNIKLFTASLLFSTSISGIAQAQTIDYGMMESIFGEPVTASATGKPQRASDAPVSMDIIGSEEIRRSGAKDIPQLLRRIAGVQVQRNAIGRADVSIRGYNKPYANRLLVLINGRQVLSDAFGQVNWEALAVSMHEIRQIEVVKGPNSSLFGFNAESGVVNIITFNPLKDDIDLASIKIGTQQHKQVDAITTAQFDNHAVRISVHELDSDGFNRDSITDGGTVTSTLGDENNEWTTRHVALDYEWQVNDSSNVRFQSTYGNSKTRGVLPYGGNSLVRQDQTANHITYTKQSDYGLITANAYRMSDDWIGGATAYQGDLDVVKVEDLFKIGSDHSVRVAGEYRKNSLTGKIVGDGNSKFGFQLFAPSVMWDWHINDKWNFTNSVRYDSVDYSREEAPAFGNVTTTDAFDRTIEEISYNSALAFKATDTDTIRASVSRGLHIPSLIEMGSSASLAPTPAGFAGNPGLEPERILAMELAWDKKLPEYNMNFRSSIFLQKAENIIGDDIIVAAPVLFTFDNLGDSSTYGVELGLDGVHNNWLRWGANYTYLKTNDDDDKTTLHYEEAQPKHQVTLLAGFDHNNWEFDTDLHYISGSTQTLESNIGASTLRSEELAGYFVLNARAGYNVSDAVNIAIEGYNLVDKHREVMYGQGSTGGPIGGNTIGRSILANLTYKF